MYETTAERDAFFRSLIQYRQERLLGEGAFGLAILAFHETEKRYKVFKLPKTVKTTEALMVEGDNLVALRDLLDPNIIQLHEFGKCEIEWNGKKEVRYYLVLAFGGTSLRQKLGDLRYDIDADGNARYLGSGKRLPLDEALRVSIDVCRGLVAAHGFKDPRVRIIHRDIKPENILIDDTTGAGRLTDFGISRVIDRSSGITSIAGTLLYMDPECFQGRAGTFSDIYSLGIVMYEMFTGELPFPNSHDRLQRPATDPRKHNPQIPPPLSELLLRALAADPKNRFQSASEMLEQLLRVSALLNPLPVRFKIVARPGPGQFLCDDSEAGQRVIVEAMESPVDTHEITRQMAALDDIDSDQVVAPIRFFRNAQMIGLVWPAPTGTPLEETFGPLPVTAMPKVELCCKAIADAAEAVGRAHAAGVVHGLINPSVILVRRNQVAVDRFGVAPLLAARSSASDTLPLLGELPERLTFMSPQLLGGQSPPSPTDDVYSLGAVLLRMLTGRGPVTGAEAMEMARGKAVAKPAVDPRQDNPMITDRLAAIIDKALAWSHSDRYENASQVAQALRACDWSKDVIDSLVAQAMRAYENNRVVEAYDWLGKALETDPGNARVHLARGTIYFKEREFSWAAKELAAATAIEPDIEGFLMLGQACLKLPEGSAAAERAFRGALGFGESADTRELLAKALRAQGRMSEALAELRTAIRLESDPSVAERRRMQLKQWQSAAASSAEAEGGAAEAAKPQRPAPRPSDDAETVTRIPEP